MIEVVNIIEEAEDGKDQERDWSKIVGAMVHRCGVDLQTGIVLGYDAVSVSNAFTGKNPKWKEVAKATGSQNAYSIMIGGDLGPPEYDGVIWQLLPLDEIGHHARRFGSKPYLGISCIGDFRMKPMSQKQRDSLIDILSLFSSGWGWDPYQAIKGHGEVAKTHDGTKAPGQPAACPGDLLDMFVLRDDVARMRKDGARRQLHEVGLVFAD